MAGSKFLAGCLCINEHRLVGDERIPRSYASFCRASPKPIIMRRISQWDCHPLHSSGPSCLHHAGHHLRHHAGDGLCGKSYEEPSPTSFPSCQRGGLEPTSAEAVVAVGNCTRCMEWWMGKIAPGNGKVLGTGTLAGGLCVRVNLRIRSYSGRHCGEGSRTHDIVPNPSGSLLRKHHGRERSTRTAASRRSELDAW